MNLKGTKEKPAFGEEVPEAGFCKRRKYVLISNIEAKKLTHRNIT